MDQIQDKAVSIYKELSQIPSLDSVSVINEIDINHMHWRAKWSFRNLARESKVNYITTGSLSSNGNNFSSVKSCYASEVATEKIFSVSLSNLKASLHEIELKSEKNYYLEIWKESHIISNTNLTKENKHGKVHTNSIFGCLNWSNASDKLVYVAEKKIPKSKSFFEKSEEGDEVGSEFIHKEDWGEQLVGSYHPTLFMYDVHTGEITDLSEFLPDDASISCALWSEDDKSLYILAWKASPWKLGLMFCKNRCSTLYKLNLHSKILTKLTDGKSCVFSPIVTPDGTQLLYLESVSLGPHRQCSKMMCLDLKEDINVRVVVDVVKQQPKINSFQGLFIDKMTESCWLDNGHQLIVSSLHRSHKALLCIDISIGTVMLLESVGAWSILKVQNDFLLASFSSPNTPTVFKVGKFNPDKIEWKDIDVPVEEFDKITWKILRHKPWKVNKDFPDLDYESVLIKPSGDAPLRGLIVNPHGGPHSLFCAAFDIYSAAFCQLGFAVLRVNYRGSIGFGQNSVLSLLGNIGFQDVQDVHQAAEQVVSDLAISSEKIFCFGGSHGGFLTLHLVGQFPDFYAAGATRNPVTNFTSKAGTNDIMDWCYLEGGANFNYGSVLTPENAVKFLNCSPIAHIAKVTAPLLFMIGLADLRVPPSQSFEYIRVLQGLEKKVKVLAYPNNNHPIACVDAEADCFVNIIKWFCKDSL